MLYFSTALNLNDGWAPRLPSLTALKGRCFDKFAVSKTLRLEDSVWGGQSHGNLTMRKTRYNGMNRDLRVCGVRLAEDKIVDRRSEFNGHNTR